MNKELTNADIDKLISNKELILVEILIRLTDILNELKEIKDSI